jgi:hypothetical protein
MRVPDFSRRRRRFATFGCAGLLLLNIPAAGGIITAVMAIETLYTVVVRNTTQNSVDNVRVFGGGCDVSFGSIPPQRAARRSFWIQHDGQLEFRAEAGSATYAITIDDYVTQNEGGQKTVTINSDATTSITEE